VRKSFNSYAIRVIAEELPANNKEGKEGENIGNSDNSNIEDGP
jgi:hypothetical protein